MHGLISNLCSLVEKTESWFCDEMTVEMPVACCDVRTSWTADRCTAVFVGEALIASVHATTSWRGFGDYETLKVE